MCSVCWAAAGVIRRLARLPASSAGPTPCCTVSCRLPSVTVTYQDLSVETDATVGAAGIPTVARYLGGDLLASAQRALAGGDASARTVRLPVLRGVQGVLCPVRLVGAAAGDIRVRRRYSAPDRRMLNQPWPGTPAASLMVPCMHCRSSHGAANLVLDPAHCSAHVAAAGPADAAAGPPLLGQEHADEDDCRADGAVQIAAGAAAGEIKNELKIKR